MKHNLDISNTFAVYRLPNENRHSLILSSDNRYIPYSQIGTKEAFVFHPFQEKDLHPAIAIPADEKIKDAEFSFISQHIGQPYSISKEHYPILVNNFIDHIKEDTFHKAICSRIIQKDMPAEDLYPLFIRLKEQYPFAFVYLVNIPGIGCWMGATPETLLSHHKGYAETVALAGTRPLNSPNDWGWKETMEQQMVEQYIANILIQQKRNFTKKGPITVRAAKVMHLKTVFGFELDDNWQSFVKELHPTPAVCGLPKKAAKEYILDIEPHDRSYYCGFLGPVNMNGNTDLFVNLRCMQVFNDNFALYVGGGITVDSNPEQELEETIWKSKTLLDIIEEVYREPYIVR